MSCWIRKPGLSDIRTEFERTNEIVLLPLRVSCNQKSARLAQHMRVPEQAQEDISPAKIDVTIKSPVGDISVVTLIRTDTTLDHSQKAEKVCVAQNFQNLFQTKKRKMYLGLVLLLKVSFKANDQTNNVVGSCSQANYL